MAKELIHLKGNTYYIPGTTNIGVIMVGEGECIVIDGGSGPEAGDAVKDVLESNNLKIRSIYMTHSHADHVGGLKMLQETYDCPIYAYEAECDAINHTIFCPFCTFGAYVPAELRRKYTYADPAKCEYLTEENLPEGWEFVKLHGHSIQMVGYRTADDVLFIGDAVSAPDTIRNFGICYIYDYVDFMDTLARLKETKASLFMPAHAEPTTDLAEVIRINEEDTLEKVSTVLDICREGKTCDEVISEMFTRYGMKLSFLRASTTGSCIKSYLARLKDEGRIKTYTSDDNRLIWQTETC